MPENPKKRTVILPVVLIAVVLAVVYGVWKAKKGGVPGDVAIKVPESTTTPNSWEIAQKLTGRDILREYGVRLERVPSSGAGVPPYQAVLTGLYDIGGFAWSGWVSVLAHGGKVKVVYSSTLSGKDVPAGILVLQNSPIHTIKDLKGKTIAVNVLGLAADYVIKLALQKAGLSPGDAQLVQVPVEQEEEALRTGQVDAAAGTSGGGTWFELALDRGGVRVIPDSSGYAIVGRTQTSTGVGFRQDFIDQHPDAVRHYVAALAEADRVIWEAFKKDPEKVRAIYADIAKEKGGNPKLAQYYRVHSPYQSVIQDADVQFWIDALEELGTIPKGQVKPSDVYTNEFNPLAKEAQPRD